MAWNPDNEQYNVINVFFIKMNTLNVLNSFLYIFLFTEDEMLEPNSEYKIILYGVSAVLCISIVVNGCTITW